MRPAPLDPDLARYLRKTAEAGRQPARAGSPQQARDQLADRARNRPPGRRLHRIYDTNATTRDGHVPVRVYETQPSAATFLYLHGGGWVMGGIETSDLMCRELAFTAGARVISVNYRLAPEFPWLSCWFRGLIHAV